MQLQQFMHHDVTYHMLQACTTSSRRLGVSSIVQQVVELEVSLLTSYTVLGKPVLLNGIVQCVVVCVASCQPETVGNSNLE